MTFSLTTTAETKILTTGNDTVDGTTVVNSADADNIVDASTTDADVANIRFTTAPVTGPTFANVETVNLALDYFNPTFDASKVTNSTIVVSTAQAGNSKASFTGIGTNGAKFNVSTGITTLTLDGTTGTSDSTSVKLQGGAFALNVGNTTALESVSIDSAGSSTNTVTLTGSAGAVTHAVTGANDLAIKSTLANLSGDTVTNGLATGKVLTVELTALATAGDLSKVAATSFSTSANSTSLLGGNSLTFAAGTTSLTVNSVDQLDNAASTLIASGSAATDVLNLTLAKDQTSVVVTTFETVNITSTDTNPLTLATLVGGTAVTSATTNFKFVGAYDQTITGALGKTFDFSGLTSTAKANLTITNTDAPVTVTGGANADTFALGTLTATGKASVVAGAGNDTITGGAGADSIQGGDGNDSVIASTGNDSIDGGLGNDIVGDGTGDAFILGGDGDDSITMSTGSDAVVGGVGNDTVTFVTTGLTVADTLLGGDGTDILNIVDDVATTDLDNVSGFETINIANGSASLYTTVDSLIASGATLTVVATGAFATTFNASAETDGKLKFTNAAAGGHTVTGGAGEDTITGGSGTDSLTGGAGNDSLVGGAGVDTLTGGTGADTITTGGQADVVKFGTNGSIAGTSMDVITDFTAGSTVLNFNGATTVLLAADTTTLVAGSNVNQAAGGLVTFHDNDSSLAAKIAAVQTDAQLDVAESIAFFVDGSNTYVYYAGALAGNADDQVVQLTGVTTLATVTAGASVTIA